jgi:hypothetical protein
VCTVHTHGCCTVHALFGCCCTVHALFGCCIVFGWLGTLTSLAGTRGRYWCRLIPGICMKRASRPEGAPPPSTPAGAAWSLRGEVGQQREQTVLT